MKPETKPGIGRLGKRAEKLDMFLLSNIGLFSNGGQTCQPVPTEQLPRRESPRVITTVKRTLLVNTVPDPT